MTGDSKGNKNAPPQAKPAASRKVAKGTGSSTLDTPPMLWGISLVQDVADMKGAHDLEIFTGDLVEKKVADAIKKSTTIHPLYKKDAETSKKKKVEALPGDPYENLFYRKASGDPTAYFLDLLNTRQGDVKKYAANDLLRTLLLLVSKRTGTWDVKDTGDFSYGDSVKIRKDLFPTEEMPVKCHLFVRTGAGKGKEGKKTNVLSFFRSDSGQLNPPDEGKA